ncbi:LapA family protein [Litorihabitans aurantiacus]|uniref:Lipopolysaccharide assembly protein A domain-containing protein n=1 Tax=Litorihabitans aurantiacus TaxID=1930061 RepID=A0AA37UTL7_9MICO|nr:lipopolysaccharide assembly protein LapA domain-containing protein [Litorihabitans aurantiacus]GMA30036.1 hypothetical protein GCM10025875_00280 [Litorihabitans aurantiacus]GMA33481.1 hypothetical protein GCM10025875_34730 [Litorihabitans aurantiacus]
MTTPTSPQPQPDRTPLPPTVAAPDVEPSPRSTGTPGTTPSGTTSSPRTGAGTTAPGAGSDKTSAKPTGKGGRDGRPAAGKRTDDALHTRTASVWVGLIVGVLVLIALVIFLLQNTEMVEVNFLGATGTAPLAVVCLIAGIGVGLVVLVVGALRIGQLRRRVKHDRQGR